MPSSDVATPSPSSAQQAVDLAKSLLSGGAGGIAQVISGHPFDTIKTKMQIQDGTAETKYRGMFSGMRTIVREKGFRALYAGALSPMAGAILHNANVFFSYELFKRVVRTPDQRHADELHFSDRDMSVGQLTLAGALAGVTICAVEVPVDLFKIKMQAQEGNRVFHGSFDAARHIFRRHGVRGVYQGLPATMIRNVPAFGCYFGSYELVSRSLTARGEKPTLLASFLGGSAAGLGFWASVYPLELVKTRMQSDASDPAQRKYRGFVHCVSRTFAKEGLAGLFKGFVPCVTRAVPVNGAIFLGVAGAKMLIADE